MKSLLAPMLLSERRGFRPFDQPGWIYELKYDGYRTLALVDAGQVQLATKSGVDCTKWYPEVVKALATIKAARTRSTIWADRTSTACERAPHAVDGSPAPIQSPTACSICWRATAAA